MIPPMIHPYGKYWEQPPRERILIDEQNAMMSLEDFKALPEYSATNPTGVYEGKMWKRHDGVFDHAFVRAGGKPEWLLCWYGSSSKPDCCSINRRKIILTNGELP